ncbi:hypothetical protein ACJX0J_010795, partial [Zea mays]
MCALISASMTLQVLDGVHFSSLIGALECLYKMHFHGLSILHMTISPHVTFCFGKVDPGHKEKVEQSVFHKNISNVTIFDSCHFQYILAPSIFKTLCEVGLINTIDDSLIIGVPNSISGS